MIYLPCKSCHNTMHGIVTYRVIGAKGERLRFICHECKERLNELSQRTYGSMSAEELAELKRLAKARDGIN